MAVATCTGYHFANLRPSKKETKFSCRLFVKEEGGPYYLLFMDFFAISFVLEAHCG